MHAESLHMVGDASRVAMLELGATLQTRKRTKDTKELLQMLSSTLNELKMEQNVSVASLQEEFNTKYHQGELRRESLLHNQSQLNVTKAHELELNQRLQAAVNHLVSVKEKLVAQAGSARTFLKTLSQRAIPGQESP